MKTITVTNETIKVSKKDIRNFLSLERGIGYYSHLSEQTLAHAVAISHIFFGWDNSETKQAKIDEIYNNAEGLIVFYNKQNI